MNSFMFTFSADQTSLQLNLEQKQHVLPAQTFRRRPTSSNASGQDKCRKSSSNDNQLFENPHNLSKNMLESPEKGLNLLRIKNSSMQLQQKKKLRSIIDTMLGKNFDFESNPKLDSVVFTHRKNLNKQRSYLTGTKKNEQKQKDLIDNNSKQNYPNDQNINDGSLMEGLQTMQKLIKPNLKQRKFQFAAIKISKKSQFSQRYPEIQKENDAQSSQNQPFSNRICVNISKQSIDRESLGKKLLKSKTPKIMYPQSDSKLPSVFRTNKHRNSITQSLKKRTKISSASYLSQAEDKIIQEEPVIIKKKRTIQYSSRMNKQGAVRSKFRPKSTMIETKKCLSQYQKAEYIPSQFYPKKLVFDSNQEMNDDINRKLGSSHVDSSNVIRITTRAKSTHINYVHRKLRDINSTQHTSSLHENESHESMKNNSAQTKQTTQQSTLQSSMDTDQHNMSENFVNSIELRQFGLGYSVTFQVQKS